MKKTRSENEVAALRAARRSGWKMGAAALVIGAVMVVLSGDFVALHCVLLAAAALAGGRAAGAAAVAYDPASVLPAGSSGGMLAALGFALPFMAASLYRWATLNEVNVPARIAALSPRELAQMAQFNIQPGLEYFAAGEWSYVFGYLLAAVLFGWLVGMVGGTMAHR